MSKSLIGPDWADVMMAVKATEDLHAVSIIVTISLPRGDQRGLLVVMATARLRAALDTARAASVSRSYQTGSGDPSMIAAATFRLIYELDRDCSTFWEQQTMPSA